MENNSYERGRVPAESRDGLGVVRALRSSLSATERERRRAARSKRRAAQEARRTLERELASFTTPADLTEMDAIVKRYSEEETEDIRSILAARRAS
jgi:hypothetical protein